MKDSKEIVLGPFIHPEHFKFQRHHFDFYEFYPGDKDKIGDRIKYSMHFYDVPFNKEAVKEFEVLKTGYYFTFVPQDNQNGIQKGIHFVSEIKDYGFEYSVVRRILATVESIIVDFFNNMNPDVIFLHKNPVNSGITKPKSRNLVRLFKLLLRRLQKKYDFLYYFGVDSTANIFNPNLDKSVVKKIINKYKQ